MQQTAEQRLKTLRALLQGELDYNPDEEYVAHLEEQIRECKRQIREVGEK